jgi:hypothetical protein
MAKLKIFLSSIYYDLKHIRRDLEQFIKQMGYEPVLNEKGNIPYGKDEELSKYCYKEVEYIGRQRFRACSAIHYTFPHHVVF